ncbi:MAG: anti-sigma factor [bacterium]|nr:MAG: anti-sigma factor [bacterium]
MKKNISDNIFDKKFQDSITKDSLKEYCTEKKENSESAVAMLVGYVLKWKRNEINHTQISDDDFQNIRRKSLTIFRRSVNSSRLVIRRLTRIAVAASVLIAFGIAGYLLGEKQFFSANDLQSQVIEFSTPRGQQSELTLPDGTFVALNYDSKLKYHISRDKKSQIIELVGEAFFKVTKNKSRVFRVITPNMSVNDLGTQFDVRAYPDDNETETTLLEGIVEIKDIPGKETSVLLKPGEQWRYDKRTGQDRVVKTNAAMATTWRKGEYYFKKKTLSEIAKTLERMYKVNIHFQDAELGQKVFSGMVYKDDGINRFFDMVNLSVPIKVKKDSSDIWIKRK